MYNKRTGLVQMGDVGVMRTLNNPTKRSFGSNDNPQVGLLDIAVHGDPGLSLRIVIEPTTDAADPIKVLKSESEVGDLDLIPHGTAHEWVDFDEGHE